MDRCDCCGTVFQDGLWIQIGRRTYKFCSTACYNTYDLPTDELIA